MKTLDLDKTKSSDLDLTMEYCGIDPKKTMDFALFQDVHVPFMFPKESQESVARTVKSKQSE
jgi:hypothetical protein